MSSAAEGRRVSYKIELSGGQRRLKEVILYVAQRSAEMRFFGAIKLNKILWRADFRSFYERGQPVTGRQYQRLELGPAPVEMTPVLNEMLREGLIRIELRMQADLPEKRTIALSNPVLRFFSDEDCEFLDESVRHYWDMTGSETSDQSHGVAWKIRHDGDPIPYEASYLSDQPLGGKSKQRFLELALANGWTSR